MGNHKTSLGFLGFKALTLGFKGQGVGKCTCSTNCYKTI